MAVLQLTALRLQWDRLRWEIMLETAEVKREIRAIAERKGRWQPPVINAQPSSSKLEASTDSKAEATHSRSRVQTSPITPAARLASSDSISSSMSGDIGQSTPVVANVITPQQHRRSSSSSFALAGWHESTPPRSSIRLPLLHSQIVNVEIRHQNLSSTLLARSGKVLDKIMDVAGPLRGLGGSLGPIKSEGEEKGGAVPDELLDAQDRLEREVQGVAAGINWCKMFEAQWKL